MPKPDPALLEPALYPFRCEIEPRFTDLDPNQHINNVALTDILQEARVRFHAASNFRHSLHGMPTMIVNFSVDFLGQAYHPEPLSNHLGAMAIGRTSHTIGQLITQGREIIAFARTVIVCVQDNQPTENPASLLEAAESWMIEV